MKPINSSFRWETFPPNELLLKGSRALEAFCRPSPIAIQGTDLEYSYDLNSCTFGLLFTASGPAKSAESTIFIPWYLSESNLRIEISSGEYKLYPESQIIKWKHANYSQQKMQIISSYRSNSRLLSKIDMEDKYNSCHYPCIIS